MGIQQDLREVVKTLLNELAEERGIEPRELVMEYKYLAVNRGVRAPFTTYETALLEEAL